MFVIVGVVVSGNLDTLQRQSNPSLKLSPSLYALTPESPSSNPPMTYIDSAGNITPNWQSHCTGHHHKFRYFEDNADVIIGK